MTPTPTPDDEYGFIDDAMSSKMSSCGWNGSTEALVYQEARQQIISHIQQNYTANSEVERVKREAKLEVLNRVKGMAVYEADNPDREYVWTWKIDREIVAIKQLSHGEDK